MKDKNLICFIPVRSGSTRLKNKNLRKINKLTLTEITINQALKSKLFGRKNIVLSSDSTKILNLGDKFGITCVKRSKKNSKTFSKVDNAIIEFFEKTHRKYSGLVLMQVTSPLRKISTLKKFVNHSLKKKLDHCLTVTLINNHISKFSKKYFNSMYKKREMTQKMPPYLYENSLLYFVSQKFFTKFKRIYPLTNWNYFITNKYESIDINDINDLNICKKLF